MLPHGCIHGLSKYNSENQAFLQRAYFWFLVADATEGQESGEVLIQGNDCVYLKIKCGISRDMAFCEAGGFVKSSTGCSEHVSEKSVVNAEYKKRCKNSKGEG